MTTREMILNFFKEKRKERKTKFTRTELMNYANKRGMNYAETCLRAMRELRSLGKLNYNFTNNTYQIKK